MMKRPTQIIFCDLGVPHKDDTVEGDPDEKSAAERDSLEEECDFCVYSDIKKKLMDKGVPEKEIAFIHSAKTEKQKAELFAKVRSGKVRILLGSTNSAPYEHIKTSALRHFQMPKLTSISSLLCEI